MVLDSLSGSLRDTLKKIKDALFIDEKLINELVKDIQKALIKADVNVRLVLDLTKDMKGRLLNEKAPSSVSKKEHLVNIVYEELVKFLGTGEDFKVNKKTRIMLVGLFGSGKTTTTAKLANYFKKRGKDVAVITADTWRPAAYDQLEQLSKQINVKFYGDKSEKKPQNILKKFEKDLDKHDVVLIDTAGRDALNEELVDELNNINKVAKADRVFLVLSSDIGQAAQKQAEMFHELCNVTDVIITKLDGTAKGGGALAACSVTGANVRFLGVGEKVDELEEFKPEGFVSRLLGMGDLEALLKKTQDAFDEKEAEDLGKKFLKGDFNLIDLYEQLSAMKKMGPLNKILDMIPGMGGNIPKDLLQGQEEKLETWKYVMQSMTKKELEDPSIIRGGRIQRISDGSGTSSKDVRGLLKQYKQSKKMMKMMKGKNMDKMMKKMQGMQR